jgi:outer membrane receptor protein involved in Fe transport
MANLRVLKAAAVLGVALLAHASSVAAQSPIANRLPTGVGEIVGKLTDSISHQPLPGGSITIRRVGDSTFAGGALPKPDGSFKVDGLVPGRYSLRVRAIGYAQIVKNDLVITRETPTVDVGVLAMTIVATKLDAQQVVAEREETVLAPDRNSYSVKNMSTAAGGTAVDVLRNIPLVEVDGSNNVSLRGNANVVVQINGRATPLKGDQLATFLSQLPSHTVKTVEVATSPSAKDDPEGTAGIINIVLNQETELGLSGGLMVGTSSLGQASVSGNIGKQQGKLILYAAPNFYRDHREMSGEISRTNLVAKVPAASEATVGGSQSPISGGINIRSEYRFTPRDVLSFDSFVFGGRFDMTNQQDYTDLDESGSIIGLFNQLNERRMVNKSQDYDLTYRRFTAKNLPRFSMELEYSTNRATNNSDLSGNVAKADASMPSSMPTEHDFIDMRNPGLNWKTDFTQQFGTSAKLETGLKFTSRSTENDFNASYLNASTGVFELAPSRTTGLDYHEDIGAGYALLSNRFGNFQTQSGLRLENAATYLDLPITGTKYDRRYASAYPSAIVSYNFTQFRSAKLSYSRRVSRPNPYQLTPVEQRLDSRTSFHGNPELRAEYTDAIEGGYLESRPWGSIQVTPYLRSTAHAVRNIQFVDTAGVSVSTFDNVASTLQIGSDVNVNAHHGPWLLGGGASAYHYSSDASNLSGNLSTNTVVWSLRANGTWKFSPKFDAQLFANYRPSMKTEGGSQLAITLLSFASRYKIWGDQGYIALRVNDPFKLQRFGYKTANGSVVEYNRQFLGTRGVYLSISRSFGKALKLQPKSQDPDGAAQPNPAGPPSA